MRVLKEALGCLPAGVKTVRLRSDTADYQHDLLRYCESGESKNFGRIEFAISSDVTTEFKKTAAEVCESEWKPLKKLANGRLMGTGKEWAEIYFVPSAIGHSKKGHRYLATREPLEKQYSLPGMEEGKGLPVTCDDNSKRRL